MRKVIHELEGVPVASLEILKGGGLSGRLEVLNSWGGEVIFPLKILVY